MIVSGRCVHLLYLGIFGAFFTQVEVGFVKEKNHFFTKLIMLDHIRKLQVIIDKNAKNMTTNDYLNAMNMLLEMYNVYQLKHIQMKPPTYVESDDEEDTE